jgi:hypothetical protein
MCELDPNREYVDRVPAIRDNAKLALDCESSHVIRYSVYAFISVTKQLAMEKA